MVNERGAEVPAVVIYDIDGRVEKYEHQLLKVIIDLTNPVSSMTRTKTLIQSATQSEVMKRSCLYGFCATLS